jgi:phosphoglycerate dehydrogenase-like enzyme
VGIVGLGRIGREFARRARVFFGQVLACDPYLTPETFAAEGVQACTLDDLLRRADAVSLHVPLNSRTRHLIGARELGLMKSAAVLVNAARGAVVDQLALADALNTGVIEGAACDVWEREPAELEHPLFRCANFIASPHVAGLSTESQLDNRTKQASEVARVLSGKPPLNPVVPDEQPRATD